MAELIWTEPALSDLDTIADYIALDNPEAARDLVSASISSCGATGKVFAERLTTQRAARFAVSADR